MNHYYKDTHQGRVFYSGVIKVGKQQIINPTEEMLNKEG